MENLSRSTLQRERQMTPRALASAIQTREVELNRLWRKIRKELRVLESEKYPGEIDSVLSETEAKYKLYQDKWEELKNLYSENDEYQEDANLTKTTVLENCKFYEDTVEVIRAKVSTLAYETKYETKSLFSNHSSVLTGPAKSRGSNASSVLKAQAIAAASGANESALYEEILAQCTLEHKTEKAIQELERVKQEAAAEANLKILRARQMAAVENARTEQFFKHKKRIMNISYHTQPDLK
ncbi:hypothetical protein HOLleu_16632 [Holothuria leucospilota]|uniref:Uncharacterized protein n=1 Tax=Holothuria leucospilota TaxID=206669 RepID=A0A9Q1HAR3_HOLLE|nr:hypothetical protein HOLleu_16632 [Holothuria leucospilota]